MSNTPPADFSTRPRRSHPTQVALTLAVFLAALVAALTWAASVAAAVPTTQEAISAAQSNPKSKIQNPKSLEWRPVPTTTLNNLRDVFMLSSTEGWAVGEGATVLRWDGSMWTPAPIQTEVADETLVEVFMLSPTDGYILGWGGLSDGGNIYHWDGAAWTHQYSTDRNPNRMDGFSPDDLWVSGFGRIYRRDASGWRTDYTDPNDPNLFALDMVSSTEGWAAGQTGVILHYANGVWSEWPTRPVDVVLYDLFFLSPSTGWAAGFSFDSYLLDFDGTDWARVYTGTFPLFRLFMLSPTDGWSVGQSTLAHFDGAGFTPVYTSTQDWMQAIHMASPTDGWAVGEKGLMLHYSESNTATPTQPPTVSTPVATATTTNTPTNTPARTATVIPSSTSTPVCETSNTPLYLHNTDAPAINGGYAMSSTIPARSTLDIDTINPTPYTTTEVLLNWYSPVYEDTLFDRGSYTFRATFDLEPGCYGYSLYYRLAYTNLDGSEAVPVGEVIHHFYGSNSRRDELATFATDWPALRLTDKRLRLTITLVGRYSRAQLYIGSDTYLTLPTSRSGPCPTATSTATATPTTICSTGWKTVPRPGNGPLRDIATTGLTDAWAVGDEGVLHWDGLQWSNVHGGGYNAVAAISPTDVWVVGAGTLDHWDGRTWTSYPNPIPGNLLAISAWSSNSIWAVGHKRPEYLNIQDYLLLHWDGNSWQQALSQQNSSLPVIPIYYLEAVVATGSDSAWAVGWGGIYGDPCSRYEGVLAICAGSENCSGTRPRVNRGMGRTGPNDFWVVGGSAESGSRIAHMTGNGSGWVPVSSPNIGQLDGVAGSAPNDVWAVGAGGFLHYDGSQWRQMPGPVNGPVGASKVAASGPGNVWAISGNQILRYTDLPVDVPSGSAFYPYVRCLLCQGILGGYSDNTFRPNNPITRGQIAKVVSNAAGYSDDPGVQVFEDVPPSNTFYTWVNRLSGRGHMGGYPCGGPGEACGNGSRAYFRPLNNATRGQLAKITASAASLNEPVSGQTFADVPPAGAFYAWIERLASRGVMGGYPCGGPGEACDGQNRPYFRPSNNVTRGQGSKIVANAFFPGCVTKR